MPGIKASNHMSDLSNKNQNEAEEEFEPNTQSVDPRPLAGVIAFVDTRSGKNGCENRGEAISHQLDALGATVRASVESGKSFSSFPTCFCIISLFVFLDISSFYQRRHARNIQRWESYGYGKGAEVGHIHRFCAVGGCVSGRNHYTKYREEENLHISFLASMHYHAK